ncbi:MAG: hypothetical protein FWC43_14555 [Planctomycetaceae bacterium]|nr:hypothetical protein [Planctomycetaceae bacterium]
MAENDIVITNMGKVLSKAIPSGGGMPIELFCTSQSLLGFPDAPTWNYKTNNPKQEVGLTETGKPDGANALEFKMAYSPAMLAQMIAYKSQGKKFEIVQEYDDESYDQILVQTVKDCFILNPGSSETTEIDGTAYMTVKFQPRGGKKLSEIVETTTKARPA